MTFEELGILVLEDDKAIPALVVQHVIDHGDYEKNFKDIIWYNKSKRTIQILINKKIVTLPRNIVYNKLKET